MNLLPFQAWWLGIGRYISQRDGESAEDYARRVALQAYRHCRDAEPDAHPAAIVSSDPERIVPLIGLNSLPVGTRLYARPADDSWIKRAAHCARELIEGPLRDVPPQEDCPATSLAHVSWMAHELAKGDFESATKACRWLGFVQAIVIARDRSTLEDEKVRNLRSRTAVSEPENAHG